MSRRFAAVGVCIPAARLREITAGAPVTGSERVDVDFALAVTELKRQQRLAVVKRARRRAVHWFVVAGLVLAALNLLICLGYAFIALALHQPLF